MAAINRTATRVFSALILLASFTQPSFALNIDQSPLSLAPSSPPLTLLVMERDHKLYYEAYNDASDIDGDNVLDIGYKGYVLKTGSTTQYKIDYYGYFDSYKCYSYDSSASRWNPTRTTANKKCTVVGTEWSGDFLNYLTMTRMDILRKVLYGGYRNIDDATTTSSLTVLRRVYVPQDTHAWAKEYTSVTADGYDIADYTSLSVPTSGRHLFASVTLGNSETANNPPLLRILQNRSERMWDWVSREVSGGGNVIGPGTAVTPTDYRVDVAVCVTGLMESNCDSYVSGGQTYYKPTGLFQNYAQSMKFGLVTGSYTKNTSGGVLRKRLGSITDEITAAGTFSSTNGIVSTINKLRIRNYNGTHATSGNNCGLIPTAPMAEGQCRAWGNPLAEMMYEATRYISGSTAPTPAFDYDGTNTSLDDNALGLPKPTWVNPYSASNWCAKPNLLLISDVNPSYDTDQVPGRYAFTTTMPAFSGTLTGFNNAGTASGSLDAAAIGQTLWTAESFITGNHFIGQSKTVYDGAPTAKSVDSFGNIRGLSPEEPTKQGGYYSASVAYFGHTNDMSATYGGAANDTGQKINTYAVALASPLPEIKVNVRGKDITLVPFAKSVSGAGINPALGNFQPTNTLADFYVESLTATGGTFRVNFEDGEQGNDYDMDAVARYSYTINDGGTPSDTSDDTLNVTVDYVYAAGSIIQHMGFVISGTTADGTYLVVRDETACGSDINYALDTPQHVGTCLPTTYSGTFTPGAAATAATVLKNPLFYAAKWGGFKDKDGDKTINSVSDWDARNNQTGAYAADGIPDNYFFVANPGRLLESLSSAFDRINQETGSFAAVAANSTDYSPGGSYIYQSGFESVVWTGSLVAKALTISASGVATIATTPSWDAVARLKAQTSRQILTSNNDLATATKGAAFRWTGIGATNQTALTAGSAIANIGQDRLDYLRGATANEEPSGNFRRRDGGNILGDIVHSAPEFVQKSPFIYPDNLEDPAGTAYKHATFRAAQATREGVLYLGANDGMLHGFREKDHATDTTKLGGQEVIAYVPSMLMSKAVTLTDPNYSHNYFVDLSPVAGDAFGAFSSCAGSCWRTVLVGGLAAGGKGYFALDITDPSQFDESNANRLVLWEYPAGGATPDSDMGYSFSEATITKTYAAPTVASTAGTSRWGVIFGNGYNSTNGSAVLFVLDAASGQLIAKIDTQSGPNNGLSTPILIDTDFDRRADFAYAGDLKGNLWKFDLRDPNPTNWKSFHGRTVAGVFTPTPLFKAVDGAATPNPQPITSRPDVGKHPTLPGYMVYFGTGKYIEVGDNVPAATPTHSFYGVWDKDVAVNSSTPPVARTNLLPQTISLHANGNRTVTNTSIDWTAGTCSSAGGWKCLGWRHDFIETGEMNINNADLRGGRVLYTTLTPSNAACTAGGTSWLMEVNYENGGVLDFPPFDIDGNGVFNDNDQGGAANQMAGIRPVSGMALGPTIMNDPTRNREIKLFSGSTGNVAATPNNWGRVGRRSWRQVR